MCPASHRRALLLALALLLAAPSLSAGAVAVANPSFETDDAWFGLASRGASELFAAVDGTAYARVDAGAGLTQTLGRMEADRQYTVVAWTRSLNAHIPEATGERKGVQRTHPNPRATATVALRVGGAAVASASTVVSVNATVVADGGANEHDDGGNVFFLGPYRMHVGNSLLYQRRRSADPIGDPWFQGNENEYWGMAVGPVSDLDGRLIVRAIGGGHTRTDLSEEQLAGGMRISSRIELNRIKGKVPDLFAPEPTAWDMNDQPIFDTVLSHLDDEAPWVFDPHYCYDSAQDRLWMTWGGHSIFLTEVNTQTGKVIDPNTGTEPSTGTEFNTHAAGVHTKILTNQPWRGRPAYASDPEAPEDWEGDAFSTQAYMEGAALFRHRDHFFACGTYGSMGDSYTIRCCRQAADHPAAPRGPYTDKRGARCDRFDAATDRYPASMLLGPDGDHLVPGHPHVWREYDADGAALLYLGYDFRDRIPSVREDAMAVRRLFFDDTGWPTIWMPLAVTVDTAQDPTLVGRQLVLELSAGGGKKSTVGFDHVSVSTTVLSKLKECVDKARNKNTTQKANLKKSHNKKMKACKKLPDVGNDITKCEKAQKKQNKTQLQNLAKKLKKSLRQCRRKFP
mmetsp:Transcript_25356/g.50513  ORF Transcript_25356/g.50513 Transcript_25356/m.50513 type:complete len:624 (-) Transcript_25356:448-2319(-)|eukprot:CAMPEP_0194313966 /NCGR_PEP_ID=MMETSP0171-20130528/10789_1 /TAXON_ID=218684 /ORGANISM="Corethron pennatum, Strain L29A3" /LENGTH=623 /DNA_ID=CAMNT_0039069149 /DNA_START=273 /DNA_END=2144 /DNA_ORIENTATION=+